MNVKTIHIFSYGETQIIGKELNKKVASDSLSTLQAVVDEVYSKKPSDNDATNDYHAINIFKNGFVDYIPKVKEEKSFRVKYSDINSTLVDSLITEVQSLT